jgi:hypothetical protein
MTIWCPVMFRDELDMLQMRMEETAGWATTVLVEAGVTHRGVPKPLVFAENEPRFDHWSEDGRLFYEFASLPDDPNPWVREHAQRNAAWWIIDAMADDTDWVVIGDLDEIPKPFLTGDHYSAARDHEGAVWAFGQAVYSVRMRTFLYAVDWEAADQDALPPTQVRATVGYIREHDGDLAGIRDRRADYPEVRDGGFHFSWLGGPQAQTYKAVKASCHKEEMRASGALELISSGKAWREGADTGIPLKPAEIDDTFPAMIRERRCPENWFRP